MVDLIPQDPANAHVLKDYSQSRDAELTAVNCFDREKSYSRLYGDPRVGFIRGKQLDSVVQHSPSISNTLVL